MALDLDPIKFLDRPFALLPNNADREGFNGLALDLFRLHAAKNPVYRGFLDGLRLDPTAVTEVSRIPFLPIELFKNHRVLLDDLDPTSHFSSSGTTGTTTSIHYVPWPSVYERSFMTSFNQTYGDPRSWRILALLPAYLEREGSSLVYMAQHLISSSEDALSGTYLYDYDKLSNILSEPPPTGKKTLLLGVTFALLELAERFPQALKNTTIMETGGMKGRGPELVREQMHTILKNAFKVEAIHSEYGMTELLSQAWSSGDGIYRTPPWMQVSIRDVNDPMGRLPAGRTGGINVIDLANIASCPFIATQDLGRLYQDGSFEVLGRFDHSDVRGCNLLI